MTKPIHPDSAITQMVIRYEQMIASLKATLAEKELAVSPEQVVDEVEAEAK